MESPAAGLHARSVGRRRRRRRRRAWFFGVAVVVIGGYYLLQNLGWLGWLNGHDALWPALLILLGVLMLIRRGRAW